MFRWEMYEHPASRIDGIEFYGLVRSFDNRYYRKGSVVRDIRRKEPFHIDELRFLLDSAVERIKMPITGPYTMMDWSFNEHYSDRHSLAMAYAEIINQEIKEMYELWKRSGRKERFEVQIDEPATTTHPSEMDIVVDSINRCTEGLSGVEFSLHVCYSKDYRILYDRIPEMNIDGYNLEYANRDPLAPGSERLGGYSDLKYFAQVNETVSKKRFVGIGGVTDVHIDTVEPVDLIRKRIEYAISVVDDPRLVKVNPDCGLRTRSREVGFQKLKNMVDAVRALREEIL